MTTTATRAGARTPEELEALLEDTLLLGDLAALAALFEAGAVLGAGAEQPARGGAASARRALRTWAGQPSYIADPLVVMQARDLALVAAAQSLNVMRRGRDGAWRYVIVHPLVEDLWRKETAMTQTMNQGQGLKPVAVGRAEGEAWWWFGSLAVVKASAADTGGQLSIIEITEPPNMAGPLHVHHHEDEAFWILEGEATFEVGGAVIAAQAGDYVYGPRDIPHRYSAGPNGCRLLFIFTPGGFEGLIRDMSVPALSRTLPPPSDAEPDWERVAAIAQAYGNELLG